jgi:Zinc finger C-x8-C-x5-C-x3-H type (and similar)
MHTLTYLKIHLNTYDSIFMTQYPCLVTLSDSSDSSPAAAPTRTGKALGRPVGSFRSAKRLPETVKAKPTFTPGTELMRPKMKIPKIPLKSRDSVVTPKDGGTVKKTITYGSIVAAAGAKAALAAAAAKAAAVTAAAASAAVAKSNYMKKSISVTPRTGESSSYSESRLPLKNPEKQAEFKAARLKKLQAASELSMAEAAEIEAVKKKHEFDEIVMKVKIQRYLQYQKDSAVMLQCFGSLLEEAFTCVSQLWGNDRSLMDRWSQSESLPKLHWEYMLSENDFISRGFTIVINSSTVDTVQVFGMDPLEKESSGASVLKMVVDSAFAIFCGQVPSMKSDVVMLVHGEAVSGRSIGMQLAAMNIHHESCYYLVAFSRNALFTPEPQPVLSPPLPPAVQAPPPPPPPSQFIGIAPSLSMMQNSQQNRAPFIQYDTLQSIGRAAANASALQHFSRPAPPSYPHEPPPPQYPQGFSPGTTARYLGNVSSDAAFHSEHDDRHLVDRSKKSRKANHEGQPSRPYSPQKKTNAPDLKSIYGDGGDSQYSFNPASSSSTSRESSYGAKNHSDPHRDQNKSKPNSSRTDRITETLKDNKRKHSQTVEDERNRSRNSSNQSNTTFLDRSRSSNDNSRDTSRDNSRDHSGHRPQEHSKDRPKDHNTDHSRDHQRGRIEPPNEPPGQLCKFFSMGTCKYGNTCRSVHSRPSDPKSKPKASTERCEICGRYSHSTSNCDDKHPQRNSSYHVSRTRWADSRYGRMWKNMGHDNTQPGISLNTGVFIVHC